MKKVSTEDKIAFSVIAVIMIFVACVLAFKGDEIFVEVKKEEVVMISHSFELGKKYVIRTVTMHYVGKLEKVTDTDLVLSGASWLPVEPRWHTFLKEGKLDEVEPYVDDVIVCRGGIIDATEWRHELPTEQK